MTRPDDRQPPVPGDDWSDLAEVWTAGQDGPDLTADLVRSMRRRAVLARLNFHFEAWGAVVAGLVGAWAAFRHDAWVLGGAALVFAAFALVVTLWARQGAEPGAAETPRQALAAAVGQARSGLRWARAGQAVGVAALLFVGVVSVEAGALPTPGFHLPIAAFLIGATLFYERHARRAKARIAGHEAAMRDLDDQGPA